MINSFNKFFLFVFFAILLGIVGLLVFFLGNLRSSQELSPTAKAIEKKLSLEHEAEQQLRFELVDANQAPQPVHDAVILGYNLLLDTPKYAKNYVGSRISCTSCHFAGGNTTGGTNGGISLAGVAAVYPHYDSRSQSVQELNSRINNCFERSLNGKPLPLNSLEMHGIITYLHWISKGIPIYSEVPWLGLPSLDKGHLPDPENGKRVYETYCAMCHGHDGAGKVHPQIPPLWGDDSFNDGAGMNVPRILASFIYYNMPHMEAPMLSVEEAQDVAAFIIQQPRPHFHPKTIEE